MDSQLSPLEEENKNVKKAATLLQAQLNVEKEKRLTLEEEYHLVLKENCELEARLVDINVYRARAEELEAEVAEMKQILKSESTFVNGAETLVPESFYISFQDSLEREPSCSAAPGLSFTVVSEPDPRTLKRSSSETFLGSIAAGDLVKGHEETCIRRAEAVKQRGISVLNEVDAQYNALKVKYEELLGRCQVDEMSLNHKAVQTLKHSSKDGSGALNTHSIREPECRSTDPISLPTHAVPEYKLLFKEIFSCIKKTKQEIDEHRTKYKSLPSLP